VLEPFSKAAEYLREPRVVVNLIQIGRHDRVLGDDRADLVVTNQVDRLVCALNFIRVGVDDELATVAVDRQSTSGVLAHGLVSAVARVDHVTSVAGADQRVSTAIRSANRVEERGGAAMADEDAERDTYLSWDAFRQRIAESFLSEEGRAAAVWAVDVLAPVLGDEWLRGTDEEDSVPREILLAESHSVALGELLELGLRLHLLAGLDGMGAIRRELKADRRVDRRVHTRAMLGVAGLAVRKGWPVSLEAGEPPTDVAVTVGPDSSLVAEVFVSLTDSRMRSGMERTDDLMHRIRAVTWPFGVDLDGSFVGGTAEEEEQWFTAVEVAARKARDEHLTITVDLPAGKVDVFPMSMVPERDSVGFSGPMMYGKDGRRLESRVRQKAQQAVQSGAGWLRVDVLDGLWQFTEFAGATLKQKGELLAAEMHPVLADVPGLIGAVFSSGPATAQGAFYGESARLSRGGFALRRPIEPGRVRETLIMPITSTGERDAQTWLELYDEEDTWLDWALQQVGLPPRAGVFGRAQIASD